MVAAANGYKTSATGACVRARLAGMNLEICCIYMPERVDYIYIQS